MGLLDKIKQGGANKIPAPAAQTPAATEKPNPFGPKPGDNPLAAKPAGKQADTPNAAGAKINPLSGKVNPLAAKPAPVATVAPEEDKKVNPLAAKAKPATAQTQKAVEKPAPNEEPKAETTAKAEKEPVVEKATEPEKDIIEAIAEDDKKAPVAEVKVETDEKELKSDDKKPATGKGKGGKKPAAAAATTAPAEKKTEIVTTPEPFIMPTTSMSFEEALDTLRSPFISEEWNTFKNTITEQLAEIVIEDDMNPSTMKVTISRLSQIRQSITGPYLEMKTKFEDLVNKEPEGLIERVKKLNISGANDLERKRAGILACMSYVAPGADDSINLYEVLSEVRDRYNFLKVTMDSVQYKTSILITMSSALKLESNHLPGEQ